MKKYIKLCKNPLGLKSTTIKDTEFTDEKLDDRAKAVLKLAIKGGMVKEVEVFESEKEVVNESSTDNKEIEVLQDQLEVANNNLSEVNINLKDKDLLIGKLADMIGYQSMDAEELAKDFKVDELKVIAGEVEGIELTGKEKQADLCKLIVEAGK